MPVKRILIIDDDKHISALLKTKLGQMGYEAGVAPSRTAAMPAVREFRPNR
jgi:DNA-binding response OmpR family regulator